MLGGPIDLTPFGIVVKGIGVIYLIAILAAFVAAIRIPRQRYVKFLCALAVLTLFVATSVDFSADKGPDSRVAFARYELNCKNAGEKIYRTVNDVEGMVWLRWRPKSLNLSDQYLLDDPYGRDCGGDECFKDLLRVTSGAKHNPEAASQHTSGYDFIETVDPTDGGRYRYTGVIKVVYQRTADELRQYRENTGVDAEIDRYDFGLERTAIDHFTARYGIDWQDVSTKEDRDNWIAGGRLMIIDLTTNELIAERRGYMIDRGLGAKGGGRSPWAFARDTTCPPRRSNDDSNLMPTTFPFVNKVLRPNEEKVNP
jgi:hypothetical protein